jgi:hypothetical protein
VEVPTRKRKIRQEAPRDQKENFSRRNVKVFRTSSDCEYSACSSGLLTDIIHTCLLYLQLAASSSRFRPIRHWPPCCSTPPLRSPLQLRVPAAAVHNVSGTGYPSHGLLLCFSFPPQPTRVPPPPPVIRTPGYSAPGTFYVADTSHCYQPHNRYVHPSLLLSAEFSLPP